MRISNRITHENTAQPVCRISMPVFLQKSCPGWVNHLDVLSSEEDEENFPPEGEGRLGRRLPLQRWFLATRCLSQIFRSQIFISQIFISRYLYLRYLYLRCSYLGYYIWDIISIKLHNFTE